MKALNDKYFLQQLDQHPNKEKYVRITTLNINDIPLETIEGKVSTGSINVDGASAVRRTCQLTLVAPLEDTIITDTYWCFNTKFKLQIGLKNDINPKYEDIIWFDMGIYLINSFSISKSTNNLTISLSGKDKMCRLNGEIGGHIPAQWDWGQIEDVDYESGVTTLTKIPIKTIICNLVRELAQERIENIIIKDLDDYGYELWEYMGEEPMYYFKNVKTGNFIYMAFDQDIPIAFDKGGEVIYAQLSTLEESGGRYYSTNTLDPYYNGSASKVAFGNVTDYENTEDKYYIVRIKPDETAGYHQIDLVYNTDLISNAGETATSVLDKIKKMLGNFEYFYNTKGQFIFQKKNDYIQELYSTSSGALTTPMVYNDMYSYRFDNEELFTAVNQSPNIGNVKNDFVVWGTRSADNLPIHARCAIDTKPTSYVSPWERIYRVGDVLQEENMKQYIKGYYTKEDGEYVQTISYEKDILNYVNNIDLTALVATETTQIIDNFFYTREVAVEDLSEDQKAIVQNYDSTLTTITIGLTNEDGDSYTPCYYLPKDNKIQINILKKYIVTQEGLTELPMSDNDATTFQIELPEAVALLAEQLEHYLYVKLKGNREYDTNNYDWRELIYQMAIDFRKHGTDPDYYIQLEQYNPTFLNGKTGYEQYYIDMEGFWRQLYNPNPYDDTYDYYTAAADIPYWNTNLHNDPNSLLFWFEFFDTQSELSKYSIPNIGRRPKVVNETSTTSIYNKGTPEIQFIITGSDEIKEADTVYTTMQIPPEDEMLFYRSSQGNSAIARINELMYTHLCLSEGCTITSVPIYYLQPNTRIYIKDLGDYTIGKLSFNLSYNGTMSITASKIYKQFY